MDQAANRLTGIVNDTMCSLSITDDSVSIYLQRKLEHLCVRCGGDALPDADYCAEHLVAKRAADKRWRKARRADARKKRKCIDCRKRSKTWRCATCEKKARGKVVDRPAGSVDKDEIWRVDPGTSWMRYRGKARRGRLTREEQRNEDRRDAMWVISEMRKFIQNLDGLAASDALPQIQRGAAKREAAAPLGLARRMIEGLEDRYE